ncbi:hypothetical protein [Paenibacillus sp. PCH8]|uniref:hypothetical protein n=1 Tax=Paenibacillus sp. PCH8 TaxID=2066524 RepID=UPI0015E3D941|nr:hypothetical protein [Paenibacillus sp. PCH8]
MSSVLAETDHEQFPEYLVDRLVDVKQIGTWDEPNLEAILQLSPDMIIYTEFPGRNL